MPSRPVTWTDESSFAVQDSSGPRSGPGGMAAGLAGAQASPAEAEPAQQARAEANGRVWFPARLVGPRRSLARVLDGP
jgi:hypothetical protein